MEILLGLLTVAATVAIPVVLQRVNHPKRELRYAVVQNGASAGSWRLLVWSVSRVDIPSALYDEKQPVSFQFSVPTTHGLIESSSPRALYWESPTELHLGPRLLHPGFFGSAEFHSTQPFDLAVDASLIDVLLVEDKSVVSSSRSAQERALRRTQARARLTLRTFWVSILLGGGGLFVIGLILSLAFIEPLGTALGGSSLVLLPVGLILLIIDVISRRLRR